MPFFASLILQRLNLWIEGRQIFIFILFFLNCLRGTVLLVLFILRDWWIYECSLDCCVQRQRQIYRLHREEKYKINLVNFLAFSWGTFAKRNYQISPKKLIIFLSTLGTTSPPPLIRFLSCGAIWSETREGVANHWSQRVNSIVFLTVLTVPCCLAQYRLAVSFGCSV